MHNTTNWLYQYREVGIMSLLNREDNDKKRETDQTGKLPFETRKRGLMPAELKTVRREQIRKKLSTLLSRPSPARSGNSSGSYLK